MLPTALKSRNLQGYRKVPRPFSGKDVWALAPHIQVFLNGGLVKVLPRTVRECGGQGVVSPIGSDGSRRRYLNRVLKTRKRNR